jgi:hypothetical protein
MIPSTRNPKSTLAIEIEDEPQIFVEIDDEATEQVAARISRAIGSEPPPPPAATRSGRAATAACRRPRCAPRSPRRRCAWMTIETWRG